jgi:dTDP-4-dehydrorhamnose reductase
VTDLLVFGQTGQVARELARLAPGQIFLGRELADLSDPAACAAAIRAWQPKVIINAAAWTAVDRAEACEPAAHIINADAPGAMARAAADMGVPILHVSTDYVFDGRGDQPMAEDTTTTAPLSAYGRTKQAGEDQIRAAGGPHIILRTSWVFSAHGQNFVKTMRHLGAARPEIKVVTDQHGGPTPARAIAQALMTIAKAFKAGQGVSGTFHFAGAPDTTWAGFAREIMAQAHLPATVTDILTSAWPSPAQRPLNSRLDCAAILRAYGIPRPDWRAGLADVLAELA